MNNVVKVMVGLLVVVTFGLMGCGGGGGGGGGGGVIVTDFGDFSISASSATISVNQGSSGAITITTKQIGVISGEVTLTALGTPSGASSSFSPAKINSNNGTSTLTLTAGPATPVGTYTITVSGTGGGNTHSTNISFTVNSPQTISQNNTIVLATSSADIFKLENNPTVGYEATISGGFKYPADKISYPSGTNQPRALAGGVNDLIDGKVILTWSVNSKIVLIELTDLDAISEGALQSSAPDAAANIYTAY